MDNNDNNDRDDEEPLSIVHFVARPVNECGRDESRAPDWPAGAGGLLLTEGGTVNNSPPLFSGMTPPTPACLPSFQVRLKH